jgi:hypothetical protein
MFTPQQDGEIPVEVLVPVLASNAEFRPSFSFGEVGTGPDIVAAPAGDRVVFFEPFSVENLYHGTEKKYDVRAGTAYEVRVFDPSGHIGTYSLGLGTAEDFDGVNFGALLADVVRIKLGAVGGTQIPWLDIVGIFLMIAGFVVGLGAVTVIDLHGFLGIKSPYWTVATTRTHKVTKPLIWLGTALVIAGGFVTYRVSGLGGTATFHALLAVILILNGLFLSFRVSPFLLERERTGKDGELLPAAWQRRIAASFVVSFFGWWTSVFLLAWHLAMPR